MDFYFSLLQMALSYCCWSVSVCICTAFISRVVICLFLLAFMSHSRHVLCLRFRRFSSYHFFIICKQEKRRLSVIVLFPHIVVVLFFVSLHCSIIYLGGCLIKFCPAIFIRLRIALCDHAVTFSFPIIYVDGCCRYYLLAWIN